MEVTREQKQKYLTRRAADLQECRVALVAKDLKILQRVGHQIKGNAITFGFDGLSPLGDQLEQASLAQNWPEMESLVDQIQLYLSQITL